MNLIPIKRSPHSKPLCVDLDGTLIKTDTLIEAFWKLIRQRPWSVFLVFYWLIKGRPYLKTQIFSKVYLDPRNLPYHEGVLAYLRDQRSQGRYLVLVTATSLRAAEQVSRYLGIFDEVMSSSEKENLAGKRKAEALNRRFGERQYDYIGNSYQDLKVWKHADQAIVVSNSKSLLRRVEGLTKIDRVFHVSSRATYLSLIRQIRVHQWTKNILVFLPLVLSHSYDQLDAWIASINAFWAFAFASSAVYILNDLFDLEVDRQHPSNQNRPFAAGDLPLFWAFFLVPILLALSANVSILIGGHFPLILLSYLFITTLYSFRLKEIVLADIIVLASLYSWRVLAGSVATDIELSEWFLTFAIFFFFSLALLKRCSELILLKAREREANQRRGYQIDDLPLLISFGIGSGYLSVLVLALYLNDTYIADQNVYPNLLWLICPLLLYWISRMWLKSYRGEMPTDPLVFALKDNTSYSILVLISILWLVSHGIFI